MTRINVVPVEELCSQHLLAEWRELPRMYYFALMCKDSTIPPKYTLGKGHMKFFLDKGKFLEQRHALITAELLSRGYTLNILTPFVAARKWGYEEYIPDEEAQALNRARISARMPTHPRWRKQHV